jgi:hypothetical protein
MGQVFAGLLERRDATLRVKMPAHILPAIFHFHGKIAIDGSVHNAVVTDGPIAIQTEARQMHNQGVSRASRLDEERPGLRVTAQDARHALLICAAGIDSGCMDGITRKHCEDGFVGSRKLPVKRSRGKFVALR